MQQFFIPLRISKSLTSLLLLLLLGATACTGPNEQANSPSRFELKTLTIEDDGTYAVNIDLICHFDGEQPDSYTLKNDTGITLSYPTGQGKEKVIFKGRIINDAELRQEKKYPGLSIKEKTIQYALKREDGKHSSALLPARINSLLVRSPKSLSQQEKDEAVEALVGLQSQEARLDYLPADAIKKLFELTKDALILTVMLPNGRTFKSAPSKIEVEFEGLTAPDTPASSTKQKAVSFANRNKTDTLASNAKPTAKKPQVQQVQQVVAKDSNPAAKKGWFSWLGRNNNQFQVENLSRQSVKILQDIVQDEIKIQDNFVNAMRLSVSWSERRSVFQRRREAEEMEKKLDKGLKALRVGSSESILTQKQRRLDLLEAAKMCQKRKKRAKNMTNAPYQELRSAFLAALSSPQKFDQAVEALQQQAEQMRRKAFLQASEYHLKKMRKLKGVTI